MPELKVLVLRSGEQIIAMIHDGVTESSDLESEVMVENPFRIIPRPDGISFQQWVLATDEKKFPIPKVHIITKVIPDKETCEKYTEHHSKIKTISSHLIVPK